MSRHRPTGTFCWCELGTTDAHGAKDFYGELFGWSFEDQDMGHLGIYTKVRLGDDELGGMYELSGPMFEGVPPHWMFHVSTRDIDVTIERVPELGGRILMPTIDVPRAGRMAVIEDPTGARFSLCQPGARCGTTTDPASSGAFGWFELQTRDPDAARGFYGALFGWHAMTDPGTPPYTEFYLGGERPFAGMIPMDDRWGGAPPNWMGYVMVDDCDRTFAKAASLGAHPIVPPTDIEKVGRFAVVADPQGAVFAFIAMAPMAA
jgi:predicted enzyme related to lactoylglutathione lyase